MGSDSISSCSLLIFLLRLDKGGLKICVLARINTPYCGAISPVVKLQCDCHL